jgi:exoribonuclease-2
LVTQRLLKAALDGQSAPYNNDDLAALARHCTEQEDNASKVERQVRKSAAALLLASRIGERFEAIVTGASDKGTWVRLVKPPVEGKVVRGFEGLDVGDRVRVELLQTDVDRGFIDFGRRTD